MNTFLIGSAVIIGGFAVIYLVAVRLGNADGTDSASDSAEETLDSSGSATATSRTRYKTHAAGGTKRLGDAVVLMPGMGAGIAFSCILFTTAWMAICLEMPRFLVIFLAALGILLFTGTGSFKGILHDDGITITNCVRLLGFTVYEKTASIPWRAITWVHYDSPFDFFNRFNRMGFPFYYRKSGGSESEFTVMFLHVNYKKAMAYAVRKIPRSKFSYDAQKKLKKMGILDGN